MEIVKYTDEYKSQWNEFVKNSKNGHFFFQRDYMEYHSDRFEDFSLLVLDAKNKLIAILPANKNGNTLYSHQGLTFGGFLVGNSIKTETMLEIFEMLHTYLAKQGIDKLVYKCIPYIYHVNPAEEDKYALFINNAKLIRRDVSSTINLTNRIKYQEQRKRAVKKAVKNSLLFEETRDFDSFWKILDDTLKHQHDAKPVHTLQEIKTLSSLFPNNIKLFVAKKDGNVLGGTLIFENEQIVHTQYLANSEEGRSLGALDFVIDKLINDTYTDKEYFDFGISNEDAGRYLNSGLITQKEGFGARAVVHDFYELEIIKQHG